MITFWDLEFELLRVAGSHAGALGCSQTRVVYQWPLKYMRVGEGIESGQGTGGTFGILDFSFYEFSYLLSPLP